MNPSHHGSDEQVFGAPQQVLGGGKGNTSDLPMNGGSTKGNNGGALLLLPLKPLPTRTAPLSSDLPIRGRPGMNPSHHSSDEQMLAQRNKSCTRGWSTKPMNGGNRH